MQNFYADWLKDVSCLGVKNGLLPLTKPTAVNTGWLDHAAHDMASLSVLDYSRVSRVP